MELKDKVALVSGSSRGIGASIARQMAKAGADVAVNYVNNRELAEGIVAEIVSLELQAIAVGGDVSDREAVFAMVQQTEKELGPVDILVNNAAALLEDVPIWEINELDWDHVFAVNVKGPLFGMQAVAPGMRARKVGAIINISTAGAAMTLHGFGAYVSSKGALDVMTRQMALELTPSNVRVNAISPGHIDTEDNLEWITTDPARHACFKVGIALGRLGKRDEIGTTAVFLASEAAGYIIGQVIYAEGGLMIWQGPIL